MSINAKHSAQKNFLNFDSVKFAPKFRVMWMLNCSGNLFRRCLHTRSALAKKCALLRRSYQRRESSGEILVKGRTQIANILSEDSSAVFNEILISNRAEGIDRNSLRAHRIRRIDPEVLYYICYHSKKLPSGGRFDSKTCVLSEEDRAVLHDPAAGDSLMVGTLPRPVYDCPPEPRLVLCLDRLIFPDNVGSLIRCSRALGVDGIVSTSGSCDFHGWKVLEASRGFGFKIPQMKMDSTDSLVKLVLDKKLLPVVGHSVEGVDVTKLDMSNHKGALVIVGNEKHGATKELLDLAVRVRIPISERTNSLNAAVAGGILLQLTKAALTSCLD